MGSLLTDPRRPRFPAYPALRRSHGLLHPVVGRHFEGLDVAVGEAPLDGLGEGGAGLVGLAAIEVGLGQVEEPDRAGPGRVHGEGFQVPNRVEGFAELQVHDGTGVAQLGREAEPIDRVVGQLDRLIGLARLLQGQQPGQVVPRPVVLGARSRLWR